MTSKKAYELLVSFTRAFQELNYEKIDGEEFEIYGGNSENGYIELWYPVVKKQPK